MVALESVSRQHIEYAVGAITDIGLIAASIRLKSVDVFGIDLRADVAVAVPLGYRAPDNSSRSARLLFSLSNSFKLCPERAQARCL